MPKTAKPRPDAGTIFLWLLVIGFIGSIVVSFVWETALPLWRSGRTLEFALNLVGFPIILFGVAVFVWSAVLFLRAYFNNLADIMAGGALLRQTADRAERRAQRRQNMQNLWLVFKTPTLWFFWGAAIITLGGLVLNAAKILGYDTLF